MTNLREGEPKSGEINLEETPAFRQVLVDVGEVFSYWYGMEPGKLPCLSTNSIRFLPDEEFKQQEEESYRRRDSENLFAMALIRLGIAGESLRPFQGQPLLIDAFDPTHSIYGRSSRFLGLTSQDQVERANTMIDLGRRLIEVNLFLLPDFNEIPLDPWRAGFKGEVSRFLTDISGRIPPGKIDQLEEAQKMFESILAETNLDETNDPFLGLIARGGEMVLLTKERTGDEPLMRFSSGFNRRIVISLASRLKKRFLSHVAKRNYSLNLERAYSIVDREWQDEQVSEAEKFLESLRLKDYRRLKDYQTVFAAYRQSQIPQIYLEWRRVLQGIAESGGKPFKLEDYPLD